MRYLFLPLAIVLIATLGAVLTACAFSVGPDGIAASPAASTGDVGKVAGELLDETEERVEADEQLRSELQVASRKSATSLESAVSDLQAGRDPGPTLARFRSEMELTQKRALDDARSDYATQLGERDGAITNLKKSLSDQQLLMWILFGSTGAGGVLSTVLAAKGGQKRGRSAERTDIANGTSTPVPVATG